MLLLLIIQLFCKILNINGSNVYEVIYAINAGGDAHRDKNNILYDRDPLMDKIGTASDYGKQLIMIGRVPPVDEVLYQTERYHTQTFGYDIPIAADGEYVLILKFCEVYFNAPNLKVFDVVLNGDHTVVSDLDIFQQVGKGVAHDENIYFTISRGRLFYKEDESEIRGGKIRVEFIKGYRDNPKINAIVLIKGGLRNIPKLPPLELEPAEQVHVEQDVQETFADKIVTKPRKPSGPKQEDPYALDDSSVMLPVFIAVGAFIPVLFCLCKL